MFVCPVNPVLTRVLGDMYLGIIFSVLKGKNKRGMLSLMSAPSSLMSKNFCPVFAASLEAPTAPSNDTWRVSAPLKKFLITIPEENESPTFWILLCDTLTSKPIPYFFFGIK